MIFAIALLGAAGAICRFLVSSFIGKFAARWSMLSTTFINIIGSMLLGVCYGLSVKFLSTYDIYMMISIGFFGAFTTFSTFSYEALLFYKSSKVKGMLFICFSIICVSICVGIGVYLVV